MQSLDAQELYKAAQALIDKMRDDPIFVGIATDLEIKTPQINVDIQRDLASLNGNQRERSGAKPISVLLRKQDFAHSDPHRPVRPHP